MEAEESQVVAWRLDCLIEAGYDLHSAELVAERLDIDLHEAVELVDTHLCPPQKAVMILL